MMDNIDDTVIGPTSDNKRKTDDNCDSSPPKKICPDEILTTSSISPEISASALPEFSSTLSSEPKILDDQSQDLEDKLAFLRSTDSYLGNQSPNISSNQESLDGLQNEILLSDINVDPFVTTSSETSQTTTGTPNMEEIDSFLKGPNEDKLELIPEAANVKNNLNTDLKVGLESSITGTSCVSSSTIYEPKQEAKEPKDFQCAKDNSLNVTESISSSVDVHDKVEKNLNASNSKAEVTSSIEETLSDIRTLEHNLNLVPEFSVSILDSSSGIVESSACVQITDDKINFKEEEIKCSFPKINLQQNMDDVKISKSSILENQLEQTGFSNQSVLNVSMPSNNIDSVSKSSLSEKDIKPGLSQDRLEPNNSTSEVEYQKKMLLLEEKCDPVVPDLIFNSGSSEDITGILTPNEGSIPPLEVNEVPVKNKELLFEGKKSVIAESGKPPGEVTHSTEDKHKAQIIKDADTLPLKSHDFQNFTSSRKLPNIDKASELPNVKKVSKLPDGDQGFKLPSVDKTSGCFNIDSTAKISGNDETFKLPVVDKVSEPSNIGEAAEVSVDGKVCEHPIPKKQNSTESFLPEEMSGAPSINQQNLQSLPESSEALKENLNLEKDVSIQSSLDFSLVKGMSSESSRSKVDVLHETNAQLPALNSDNLFPLSSSTQDEGLKLPKIEKSLKDNSLILKNADSTKRTLFETCKYEENPEKIKCSFPSMSNIADPESSPITEVKLEVDKKSEVSAMDVESTTCTTVEGSIVDTLCDSGETSPSTSTPADSCQASAAPSPLLKDDPSLVSESLLYDESSMDTKDMDLDKEDNDVKEEEEEEEEEGEEKERKPLRGPKKRRKGPFRRKKIKAKTTPVLVDEETRMSANGISDIGIDEDSQSSLGTLSKREVRRYRCEVIVPESTEVFTADKVYEYMWPLEGMGEHYFIQEHISQYLGIMSFKRKYPDVRRRPIESQEKEYLKEMGLVSEMACDLGLTAVRSEDLLDIMFSDFPGKYEELQRVLRERKEKHLKEKGKVDYQVVKLDKSKMQEYSGKAALNASKWNAAFNRDRHEERRYAFDLQTFTLHMPVGSCKRLPSSATKMGYYPIAVLPGQYTDYCKKYSTNELKGMPLQTVLAGPFTAEELAAELQQGVDSDEESAVASFGTCADIKEELEVTPRAIDPLSAEKQPRCKVCNGGRSRNKDGKPEPLIICGTCRTASHPTCIDLTLAMTDKIESYSWQCMDCKTCAQCNDPDDEERMIFCDMCDRGYHIYCVGLRRVPNGRWHCKECAICYTCGSRNPSGNEHIKNAEWQHEFKKDKDNKQLRYTCTLCVPCDKYWKRRQFCSVCMKVYRSIPEDGMVRCSGCPKYVHKDGCSILHDNERYCNICFKSRNKTALNHSRIIAAAKKKMATGNVIWK